MASAEPIEHGESLRIDVGCTFVFETAARVPVIFVVRPEAGGPKTFGVERFSTTPATGYHDYADIYGNLCRRMVLPAGSFALEYDARMRTSARLDPSRPEAREVAVADLPDDVLLYTLPSRYCLSDVLAPKAVELFSHVEPGWTRVQAVVDFVHGHLRFGYGSSTVATTAVDAFESGRGVCRDYAHLAIAFCRALNIPARYAFGYLPDIDVPVNPLPMDFCAWTEVYLDDRWWTFDPRNNDRRKGRLPIARGRDALDVAMATTYGTARLVQMGVRADLASDETPGPGA